MAAPLRIGHYQVVRQIGRGGMGLVYEAIDPRIHRRVAIKLLRPDILAEYPELTERLSVEARAANLIGHPGVVQVTDVGLTEDGSGYLVMEFLEGQTLSQRLYSNGGALPVPVALALALQIAKVLQAGHDRGVLHRDFCI